jgi:hypothetical protein
VLVGQPDGEEREKRRLAGGPGECPNRHGCSGGTLYGSAIDARCGTLEDECMSEVTFTAPRRSGRVFHKMRVRAQGRGHDGRKFREVCETVVVNSHGGLLFLKNEIDEGEMLVVTNPDTDEEQECRVVFLGDAGDKGQRVGIEFLSPAPRFWGVDFGAGDSSN